MEKELISNRCNNSKFEPCDLFSLFSKTNCEEKYSSFFSLLFNKPSPSSELIHPVHNNQNLLISYYHIIIGELPNYVYWLNSNGIVVGGNNNFARLLGLESNDQLFNLSLDNISESLKWSKEQSALFKENVLKVISTRVSSSNIEEAPIILKGEEKYYSSTSIALFDAQKNFIGVVSTWVDVSPFKQEATYLSNILDKLPACIYWKDNEGKYLGGNKYMEKMAGVKEITGKTDYDMRWKEYAAEICTRDKQIRETNISLEIEETPIVVNGQEITMLTRKTPLKDVNNKVIGITCVSIDITERKKLEEELRRSNQIIQKGIGKKEDSKNNLPNFPVKENKLLMLMDDNVCEERIIENAEDIINSCDNMLSFFGEVHGLVKSHPDEISIAKNKLNIKERLSEIIKLNKKSKNRKRIICYPTLLIKDLNF